jgi:hypothetical protein
MPIYSHRVWVTARRLMSFRTRKSSLAFTHKRYFSLLLSNSIKLFHSRECHFGWLLYAFIIAILFTNFIYSWNKFQLNNDNIYRSCLKSNTIRKDNITQTRLAKCHSWNLNLFIFISCTTKAPLRQLHAVHHAPNIRIRYVLCDTHRIRVLYT